MDKPSTIFAYYVGGLALLGSAISSILYCRNYLPSVRIKILQEVYRDTKDFYEQVRGEGLLPSSDAEQIEVTLLQLEYTTISLRDTTYKCTTSVEEARAAFKGLSRAIGKVLLQVKQLRAKIVTVSEEQNRARRRVNLGTPRDDPSSIAPPDNNSSARESLANGDISLFLPTINVPLLPGYEARSLITGFLSYNNRVNDQPSVPDSGSDTASTAETLIDRPTGRTNSRLLPFFQRWMRSTAKGSHRDLEAGPVQDNNLDNHALPA